MEDRQTVTLHRLLTRNRARPRLPHSRPPFPWPSAGWAAAFGCPGATGGSLRPRKLSTKFATRRVARRRRRGLDKRTT